MILEHRAKNKHWIQPNVLTLPHKNQFLYSKALLSTYHKGISNIKYTSFCDKINSFDYIDYVLLFYYFWFYFIYHFPHHFYDLLKVLCSFIFHILDVFTFLVQEVCDDMSLCLSVSLVYHCILIMLTSFQFLLASVRKKKCTIKD